MDSTENESIDLRTHPNWSEWSEQEESILTQLTYQPPDRPSVTKAAHWEMVSSTLQHHGYRRTPTACRIHWIYITKSRNINTQAIRSTRDGQQVLSSTPTAIRSAPIPITSNLNTPCFNKRPLIHPETGLNNNWDAGSRHTKRLKGFPMENLIRQGALKYQPILPSNILSDRPQRSLEEASPISTAQEQGQNQRDKTFHNTTDGMSRVSHEHILQGASGPPDPRNRNESQSGLKGQPTSGAPPNTPPESPQALPGAPGAVDSFESITVEVEGCVVDQLDGSSHLSITESLSAEKDSAIPQPVIQAVETPSIPEASERDKQVGWASRQVESFEADIQKLKCDATARTVIVASIDREIENFQGDYDKLIQGKQEEIARVLRELEERHNKKCEALKSKLENLNESKRTEIGELKRNASEVSRKEIGLVRFQAIIDYYAQEDVGDD